MENTNTQNDFKRTQTTANWYEMKLEIMQKKPQTNKTTESV